MLCDKNFYCIRVKGPGDRREYTILWKEIENKLTESKIS